MAFTAADHEHMARALQLARRGIYTTDPNPRVGCVVVDQVGKVVGEGWHMRTGEPHAEIHALEAAGAAARGATAYVTLEPCAHTGRTPPCTDTLLAAGVGRVVCAMQDPNHRVAGGGIVLLLAAGALAHGQTCGKPGWSNSPGQWRQSVDNRRGSASRCASTAGGQLCSLVWHRDGAGG